MRAVGGGAQRGAAQRGFVSSCGVERLARWPGEAPLASRRTPGQRRAAAAARPVCGPEGKGKGHGDVEGEQVRARGRPRPAGASEREEGEGGRGDPARPSRVSRLPGAPAPRLCCLLRRRRRGFPEAGAVTPAELGAGREPAPERPGATVVAPRDRGARCLPRGASHRSAAGLRGKRVPGGRQFPSPSALTPAARAGTTGCTPLFFYSHSPRALCRRRRRRLQVPRGAGLRSQSVFATKQQQKPGALPSALVRCPPPCPLPTELALRDLAASVVVAPRASVQTLPQQH